MKNIILHIGLPKTSSKYLQSEIFPNLNDVYFAGKQLGNPDRDNRSSYPYSSLFIGDYEIKDDFLLNFKNFLLKKEEILNFVKNLEEETFLFSNEDFTVPCESYYKVYAQLLKDIFPKAKIILMTRKQADWAESFYNQITRYLKNSMLVYGGSIGINDYYDYKKGSFKHKKPVVSENIDWNEIVHYRIDVNKLDWNEMAGYYMDLFGKRNVLVLPYELFKADSAKFLEQIYAFMDVKPYFPETNKLMNAREGKNSLFEYNPALVKYGKFIYDLPNSKFKNFIQKNDRGIRKFLINNFSTEMDLSEESFTAVQKQQIMKLHIDSNKKLSELVGINLSEYGYY